MNMPVGVKEEELEVFQPTINLDLEGMTIERIVIHRVFPRKDGKPVDPEFGEDLTELPKAGIDSLRNRLVKALGNASHGVQMDISNVEEGGFFSVAKNLMDVDQRAYVHESRRLAEMLTVAQSTRDLPGGALVIIDGKTGRDAKRYMAVIKAEVHDGFNLGAVGKKKTALSYLSDLLLTPAQRLYKIGLLWAHGEGGGSKREASLSHKDYAAYVYDQQMDANGDKSAAQYFFRQFLGFEIVSTNKQQTREFYRFTKKFIAEKVSDQDKKLDLFDSLYVSLKVSQSQTISISQFAESYFSYDEKLRDEYIANADKAGLPQQAIVKDISLLKSVLKRRKVNFSGSVTLSAPADKFKELVEISKEHSTEDRTAVFIKGKIESQE